MCHHSYHVVYPQMPLSEIILSLDSGISVNGEDRPADDGEPGVLKVSAVSEGRFFPEENKAIIAAELSRLTLYAREGDLLISRANTYELIAACGLVERDHPNLFLPDKLWRVVLRDPNRDHALWLLQVLNSPDVRRKLKSRASGTSGSMKNISKEAFLGIPVFRPCYETQRVIATILRRWDVATYTHEDLIAVKLHLKHGLMQQLLTGKRRFKGFASEWKHQCLGSFLTESRIRGSNGAEARKLTVRLYGKGVCPKGGTRPGSNATQFYTRRAGQFIYSKLDFLNGAFGIVPPSLDGYESSLDLPAFDVDKSIDSRWLLYFVTRPGFYRNQLGLAHGGRKARRVNPSDLLKLSIAMPEKNEQVRIADALETLDCEIDMLGKQLDALKCQKKGLMQKLLTGEVRVKPEEE